MFFFLDLEDRVVSIQFLISHADVKSVIRNGQFSSLAGHGVYNFETLKI